MRGPSRAWSLVPVLLAVIVFGLVVAGVVAFDRTRYQLGEPVAGTTERRPSTPSASTPTPVSTPQPTPPATPTPVSYPSPLPVAQPPPTPDPKAATAQAWINAVNTALEVQDASFGSLASDCSNPCASQCRLVLVSLGDNAVSVQLAERENPAPSCLSNADSKLSNAEAKLQQGAYEATKGIDANNPVLYERGMNEIAQATSSVQSAASDANRSVC
jgi:hypothetical protein